jgi:hypothetical protein
MQAIAVLPIKQTVMWRITTYWNEGLNFFLILAVAAFLSGCDSIEGDVLPQNPLDGSSYIDLYSRITTNGNVSLEIKSLPQHGSLSEVAAGFLKYSPDNGFKGSDAFTFSVFGQQNNLLLTDTITIIVNDSTDLPCQIYPKEDVIYTPDATVDVPVLRNDFICGDTSDVVVQIYQPGGFPPIHGTATVTAAKAIRYTTNSTQSFTDTVLYKVSRASDSKVFSFGALYIHHETNCDTEFRDLIISAETSDSSTYPLMDTLFIALGDTAMTCGKLYSNISITKAPQKGTYEIHSPTLYYFFEVQNSEPMTDSLRFKLCDGPDCLDGRLRIDINH